LQTSLSNNFLSLPSLRTVIITTIIFMHWNHLSLSFNHYYIQQKNTLFPWTQIVTEYTFLVKLFIWFHCNPRRTERYEGICNMDMSGYQRERAVTMFRYLWSILNLLYNFLVFKLLNNWLSDKTSSKNHF
jgi:hypothetical protein